MIRTLRTKWALLAIACLFGVTLPLFLVGVRLAGRFIPQPQMEADYLIGLTWAIILGISITMWPVAERDKGMLIKLWVAKSFVTLGFMLFYEWYYPLDASGYFGLAQAYHFDLGSMGFGSDTNFHGLVWLYGFIAPTSFHAMKVTFSMIGFIALYFHYLGVRTLLGRDEHRILALICLFPSILFWSSTLGKDPLQLLGIGMYVYGVACWRAGSNRRGGIFVGVGLILAAYIRVWIGTILTLPLVVYALLGIRDRFKRVVLVTVASVALVIATQQFAELFRVQSVADISLAAEIYANGFAGGSSQGDEIQFTGIGSMVGYLPLGMFTALFRPLPGEVMNPFGLLSGMENLLLLGLLGLAIWRSKLSDLREPIVAWGVVLILTWATSYAFIAFNLGAIVRFKLQILPCLLLLLVFLARRRQPAEKIAEGPSYSPTALAQR